MPLWQRLKRSPGRRAWARREKILVAGRWGVEGETPRSFRAAAGLWQERWMPGIAGRHGVVRF